MMDEIKALHAALNPVETLFVVDAMTGQDAANTAKAFSEALPLTGVILTKTDGDARGGAALSVRYITGRPIKFIGVSEKPDGLDAFHPDRIAQRILGMGDVLSLVEQVEQNVDREKGAEACRESHQGQALRHERHARPVAADAQHGRNGVVDGQAPGRRQFARRSQVQGQRQGSSSHGRDHQFDDEEGAPASGFAERFAQGARCARFRHAAAGRQPLAQAVHADGKDDVEAVVRRREGLMRQMGAAMKGWGAAECRRAG
jgi:hypothetical protein